jgi:hypothetical protein
MVVQPAVELKYQEGVANLNGTSELQTLCVKKANQS